MSDEARDSARAMAEQVLGRSGWKLGARALEEIGRLMVQADGANKAEPSGDDLFDIEQDAVHWSATDEAEARSNATLEPDPID
jgi:hypothetical protein